MRIHGCRPAHCLWRTFVELTALSGLRPLRPTNAGLPPLPRPRDNGQRERSAAPVFVYEGGCPFHVPDPTTNCICGFAAVRWCRINTIAKFQSPDDGTLLREITSTHVFRDQQKSPLPASHSTTSVRVLFNGVDSLFLDSVTLSVPRVTIGGSCVGTVHLKTAFPDRDLVVTLTTNQPTLADLFASVTAPASTPYCHLYSRL